MSIHNCGSKMSDIPLGGIEALKDEPDLTPSDEMELRIISLMQDVSRLSSDLMRDADKSVLAAQHTDYFNEMIHCLSAAMLRLDTINEQHRALKGMN